MLHQKGAFGEIDSFTLGSTMGGVESDQMMALLQELSLLKELDAAFEANPTESEREEHQCGAV